MCHNTGFLALEVKRCASFGIGLGCSDKNCVMLSQNITVSTSLQLTIFSPIKHKNMHQ